jgi:hypothetical protein
MSVYPDKTIEFISEAISIEKARADALNEQPDYKYLSRLYDLLDELSYCEIKRKEIK